MTTKKGGRYGGQLRAALEEALAIERGTARPAAVRRVPLDARSATVDDAPSYSRERIAGIRRVMEVSQTVFAKALNVSAETVRAWEQGKRVPDGAAVRLLEVAEDQPQWFLDRVRTPDRARPRRVASSRKHSTRQSRS